MRKITALILVLTAALATLSGTTLAAETILAERVFDVSKTKPGKNIETAISEFTSSVIEEGMQHPCAVKAEKEGRDLQIDLVIEFKSETQLNFQLIASNCE